MTLIVNIVFQKTLAFTLLKSTVDPGDHLNVTNSVSMRIFEPQLQLDVKFFMTISLMKDCQIFIEILGLDHRCSQAFNSTQE
jgi:hypothetical protein